MWAKRLEQGRLLSDWNTVSTREMDWTSLKLPLEGIGPKRVRRRYKNSVLTPKNARSLMCAVSSPGSSARYLARKQEAPS